MDTQSPVEESRPVRSVASFWRIAAQAATVGIFLLLFGAFLDLARALLLPVTAAFVIGTMLDQVHDRVGDRRIGGALQQKGLC